MTKVSLSPVQFLRFTSLMSRTDSGPRLDGNIATVYYFWDPKTGPERTIAAAIWDPVK